MTVWRHYGSNINILSNFSLQILLHRIHPPHTHIHTQHGNNNNNKKYYVCTSFVSMVRSSFWWAHRLRTTCINVLAAPNALKISEYNSCYCVLALCVCVWVCVWWIREGIEKKEKGECEHWKTLAGCDSVCARFGTNWKWWMRNAIQ